MTASPLTTGLAAAVIALAGRGDLALPSRVQLAAADCNAAAERVVARTGGQLLSVSASREGGRTVCRVTVLVPASDHKRPRKMTVTVSE